MSTQHYFNVSVFSYKQTNLKENPRACENHRTGKTIKKGYLVKEALKVSLLGIRAPNRYNERIGPQQGEIPLVPLT